MNSAFPEWKSDYIRGLEESLKFFSNESKLEREVWVVRRLVSALGIGFKDDEFKLGQEPTDVQFRDGCFQVKEMLNAGRKRMDELREKIIRARNAVSYSDLIEHCTPRDITFAEIVDQCSAYARIVAQHYGPTARNMMDLVYYFNYVDYYEKFDGKVLVVNSDFRSFSVVSNGYCCVVHTSEHAPLFLSQNKGRIIKLHHGE